jgi:hypothetical protein
VRKDVDDDDGYKPDVTFSKLHLIPVPDWLTPGAATQTDTTRKGAQLKKHFHELMESLIKETPSATPAMDESERAELASRIDRGLIISDDQLKILARPGTLPYEKVEARGMDYSGKLAIARSALLTHSSVEIMVFDKNTLNTLEKWVRNERDGGCASGADGTISCFIEEITKTSGGDTLKIKLSDDGGRHILLLGKIGIIRRRKRTLFE